MRQLWKHAATPRRKTVSPLVSDPVATPTAVSSFFATCEHLRTGLAQAKQPQQPLSACGRDDESRGLPTCAGAAGLAFRVVPLDSVKRHSDRAVRPLRCSRRRPRHRHPGAVGWRGARARGCWHCCLRGDECGCRREPCEPQHGLQCAAVCSVWLQRLYTLSYPREPAQ